MECLIFTKFMKGLTVEEIASCTKEMGFDGVDLLVREGWQVEPKTAADKLYKIIHKLRSNGVSVPALTSDIINPKEFYVEDIYKACNQADCHLLRLGYWKYEWGKYKEVRFKMLSNLVDLENLSRKYNVKSMIQLHGGKVLHASASQAYYIIRNFNSKYLGVYIDFGNMIRRDGREDWGLGIDILRDYLCFVGIKDAGWFRKKDKKTGKVSWHGEWVPLGEGMVPWGEIIKYLKEIGYNGPLSFHSHYEIPFRECVKQTKKDLVYIRKLL